MESLEILKDNRNYLVTVEEEGGEENNTEQYNICHHQGNTGPQYSVVCFP